MRYCRFFFYASHFQPPYLQSEVRGQLQLSIHPNRLLIGILRTFFLLNKIFLAPMLPCQNIFFPIYFFIKEDKKTQVINTIVKCQSLSLIIQIVFKSVQKRHAPLQLPPLPPTQCTPENPPGNKISKKINFKNKKTRPFLLNFYGSSLPPLQTDEKSHKKT